MVTVTALAQTPRWFAQPGRDLVATLLLAVLGLLVFYPIALLVVNGLFSGSPAGAKFDTDLWSQAWQQPGIVNSIVNSLQLVAVVTAISMPLGILLAWLGARTDMPGKGLLNACCWVAFFLPTLPCVLGWILLLDPDYGLINKALRALLDIKTGPLDIYSFWGIVFAHLMTKAIAVKYIFLLPAFRNLSSSLEKSSRIAGGTALYTLIKIVMPVLLPAIVITLVVSLINALESFEIELILGQPIRFNVFSTKIYALIHEEPPQFGMATVLGLGILAGMVPLILFERVFSAKRSYVTLSSHFKAEVLRLRKMRWPAFLIVALFCVFVTVVPLTLLLISTFMRVFGFFDLDRAFTLTNWTKVIADPLVLQALYNTFKLGIGAAVLGTMLAAAVAYITVRTRYPLRQMMDLISWLPASIPGIILGLGMLWMFLTVPLFHPLYGTIGVLICASVIATLTTGVQLIKSNMMQLSTDMEEASFIAGGSWLYTFRRIVIPLLGQVMISTAILTFASAARNVANVAMLVTAENRPLAMLQVDYMVDGAYERAAVIGVLIVLITTGVAGLAILIARRAGLRT